MMNDGITFDRAFIKQTAKYLFWSAAATLVSYSCYMLLTRIYTFSFMGATMIASLVANTFSYFTNHYFVFIEQCRNFQPRQLFISYIEFMSSRLFTCFLESLVLTFFIEVLSFYDIAVKAVSGLIFGILNYLFTKLVVFEERSEKYLFCKKQIQLKRSSMKSSLRGIWSVRYL